MVSRFKVGNRERKMIDACFDSMYKDYQEGRDIDAIIMGYGFTFTEEFKIAKEYFLEKIKEYEAQSLIDSSVKELDVDQDISDILARQRNKEVGK